MKTSFPPLHTLRLDFPPEVAAEREQAIGAILRLMTEDTPLSIREACRLQAAWLERYPGDYVMLDLGESLWMLADAMEATAEPEAAADEEPALSASR